MSKVAALSFALAVEAGHGFVVPARTNGQVTAEAAPLQSTAAATAPAMGDSTMYGTAMVATAAAGVLARGKRSKVTRKALHGIKFPYSLQKDTHADLEFLNDVGYLPDGTPLNKAGNCINHPEIIMPDPHTPGSPLPRAEFTNSIGYLPDGTPMNAAGNALNHPETMQPDMHVAGSPLPASVYSADVGYLVDGTDLVTAGNNSVRGVAASAPAAAAAPVAAAPPVSSPTPVAASFTSASTDALHGVKFSYSKQKDAYADLEFLNDVGYLPDGTPMNMAGNCINHPENIQADSHAPGSPLPRANLHNSIGYLVDGTPMNAAGNCLNHPETMQPDMHAPGSPLPASVYSADVGYLVDGTDLVTAGNNSVRGVAASAPAAAAAAAPVAAAPPVSSPTPVAASFTSASTDALHGVKFSYSKQKDAYADLEFLNDVGYLPDGTPMNMAGNCINHPENIQADSHAPGSPLPRANLHNSIGYLVDGTPMNAAGNCLNHPETMQPDMHAPGSPLPASVYSADVGYLVDGTDLVTAGNNSVRGVAASAPAAAAPPAAAPQAAPQPVAAAFVGSSTQTSTTLRKPAGFLYSVQKDAYVDLTFGNDVGYLPDGTPMNLAGNCMNHPESIGPDPHAPGSPLPRALFVNDVGYLPDGTPMNAAGNAINHPETMGPDPHSPGSPLPPSAYAADIGYLVDGTPLDKAGNNAVH